MANQIPKLTAEDRKRLVREAALLRKTQPTTTTAAPESFPTPTPPAEESAPPPTTTEAETPRPEYPWEGRLKPNLLKLAADRAVAVLGLRQPGKWHLLSAVLAASAASRLAALPGRYQKASEMLQQSLHCNLRGGKELRLVVMLAALDALADLIREPDGADARKLLGE